MNCDKSATVWQQQQHQEEQQEEEPPAVCQQPLLLLSRLYHTGLCTVLCGRLCDTCQCTVWAVCSPSISCCSGGDIGLPLAAGDVGQPAAFAYLTLQGPTHGIGHWVSMQAWQTLLHCIAMDKSPRNPPFLPCMDGTL